MKTSMKMFSKGQVESAKESIKVEDVKLSEEEANKLENIVNEMLMYGMMNNTDKQSFVAYIHNKYPGLLESIMEIIRCTNGIIFHMQMDNTFHKKDFINAVKKLDKFKSDLKDMYGEYAISVAENLNKLGESAIKDYKKKYKY